MNHKIKKENVLVTFILKILVCFIFLKMTRQKNQNVVTL